ncbi:hypothetical protein [Actinoplanes xinjiangensis]|uniref:BRCT domain-containing protein n=1 Tax=Actinoplanes xinjiangensis TaxID=512350 RepID=A0A316FAT0_9ACTN|nr:hypothetical protein [Actinoplanes xinjiangensis]PWK44310.1 hypothetical protein BC793_112185 [Actinoplanes xinjiangensis]GIF37930.1 hypothetical protein Axi01nite_22410 [Actinoplanes xinjiangensis]
MGQERFAQQTARISREIRDSGLRVFALAAAVEPVDALFGNLVETDGELTGVQVEYSRPDGPWVQVESARGLLAPLRMLVEQRVRRDGGRYADLAWIEQETTLLVDGRPEPAETVRAGDRWQAWRCDTDGVRITVVSRDWVMDPVAVVTQTDPAPMLDRLATVPAAEQRPHRAEPIPPSEPHRVLIETILCRDIEHAKWVAEGGPMPGSPVYAGELWQAAVLRQRDLSDDRDTERADRAIGAMVHLVSSLQHEFDWFRDDAELRRRATSEILLKVTGLAPEVPSATAQEAWYHRAEGRDWRAAWSDWATGRP